jgi:1,4-dihydroxy-6-naphthoate synthase
MVTLKIGALADSGDLYPFIPIIEGKVRPEGFNVEVELIPTVQRVNEIVIKREVDVSVPSAALYPYIQDYYYILGSAVASAVDGVTGMPILSVEPIPLSQLPSSRLIVHGLNTTAFTLYRIFFGKYRRLIVVERVLDEIKALGREGDILVAVHEIKMMYQLKKLGVKVHRVTSMWDLWRDLSKNLPMPMGMVVVNEDLGPELSRKFAELYERSKRYAESHIDQIIPKDAELMSEVHREKIDPEIIKHTIWADIKEYNVPREDVVKGLQAFYEIAWNRGVLPRVKGLKIL